MFAQLICLLYYNGCWVSLYLGYSANEGICPSLYDRLVICLIKVGYLSINVSPTSLSQWSTLLFLLILMYKHITPITIYYYSHTFSLIVYTFSIMYTAWCSTLYHNHIYCWALSIYNYFNLIPMLLYYSHTLLSHFPTNVYVCLILFTLNFLYYIHVR